MGDAMIAVGWKLAVYWDLRWYANRHERDGRTGLVLCGMMEGTQPICNVVQQATARFISLSLNSIAS